MSSEPTTEEATNDRVVADFCAAWGAGDMDTIASALADDVIYHNIPMDPLQGKDTVLAVIGGFLEGNSIVFETLHQVARGSIVMNERVDHLTMGDAEPIPLPVMGTFELVDGQITHWRDYFDLATFQGPSGASAA